MVLSGILTIASLMMLGMWLERIGGKQGFLDELFTPVPLGLTGLVFVLLEGAMV
jgi:hypothetical protein